MGERPDGRKPGKDAREPFRPARLDAKPATLNTYKIMAEAAWLHIARLEAALAAASTDTSRLHAEIAALRASLSEPKETLRRVGPALRSLSTAFGAAAFGRRAPSMEVVDAHSEHARWAADANAEYARWVAECDTLDTEDRLAIRRHMATFESFPLISVVMPVYNPRKRFFREALDSICRQIYPHWELCVADDASQAYVGDILRDYAARDPRVKWMRRKCNGHISAASNSALTLATGAFVALMDHDDILPDHALYEVVADINNYPDVDLIYSDEDHIDECGRRSEAYFKSDWNAELVLGQNMVSHLGVYRRTLIEQVGGFREGFEGSQDHDLALRVMDATDRTRIRHIPAVLYHWRQNSGASSFSEAYLDRCAAAARQAVSDHLRRRGQAGSVERTIGESAWQRVRRPLPLPPPLVTLIVPTKDQAELLGRCLDGLLNRTSYPNLEILVVDHDSVEPATHQTLDALAGDARVRIVPYSGPFNFAAINNAAVEHANGDIVGFINNDIEVIDAGWLNEMVSLVVQPEVGAVGAKLLYADGRIQHAGILIGDGGVAGHYGHLKPRDDPGYFGRCELTSEVSAVTAACMLVRKTVYEEVQGFDAVNLPVAYNDVDFCLRLRECGYINIFTPFAELYHLESASRGPDTASEKVAAFNAAGNYMIKRWATDSKVDPYYSPNLSVTTTQFGLAFPSRRKAPWLAFRSVKS